MRVFDEKLSKQLQEEELRKRLSPWLSEPFDPVVLERETFLDEVGLQKEDEPLLRAGAAAQGWLATPVFARALAEELKFRKETAEHLLNDYATMKEDQQWLLAQRVFLRMEHLVLTTERERVAGEIGCTVEQLDAWRKEWKSRMGAEDHLLALGIQMLLLGIGLKKPELLKRVRDQSTRPFLFFFRLNRPILTDVKAEDAELLVQIWVGEEALAVRQSMAKEIEENSKLGPELWAKQWVDYFQKHKQITTAEFRTFLRHLEEGERYKWSHLMAGSGAKARRGVAAACNGLLESLASDTDQASIQRMLDLTQQFSERHEMEAILKRRFGV